MIETQENRKKEQETGEIFDETKNRSIAVHSAGLLEGLDKIYKAERLVKELRAGKISQ